MEDGRVEMKRTEVLQIVMAAFIVTCARGEAVSQTDFWQKINGDTVSSIAINSNGRIFVGRREGVARSTDDGQTWTLTNQGVKEVSRFAFNSLGTVVAGGGGGVCRSTDKGSNWIQTTDPGNAVKALAINDSGYIFAGWGHEMGGGVERSTDNGTSWVDAGLRANSYALAINSSGTIFSGGNRHKRDNLIGPRESPSSSLRSAFGKQ
jgi:photosystem II stability/assembly factor-like uncharacterized protein